MDLSASQLLSNPLFNMMVMTLIMKIGYLQCIINDSVEDNFPDLLKNSQKGEQRKNVRTNSWT